MNFEAEHGTGREERLEHLQVLKLQVGSMVWMQCQDTPFFWNQHHVELGGERQNLFIGHGHITGTLFASIAVVDFYNRGSFTILLGRPVVDGQLGKLHLQ